MEKRLDAIESDIGALSSQLSHVVSTLKSVQSQQVELMIEIKKIAEQMEQISKIRKLRITKSYHKEDIQSAKILEIEPRNTINGRRRNSITSTIEGTRSVPISPARFTRKPVGLELNMQIIKPLQTYAKQQMVSEIKREESNY